MPRKKKTNDGEDVIIDSNNELPVADTEAEDASAENEMPFALAAEDLAEPDVETRQVENEVRSEVTRRATRVRRPRSDAGKPRKSRAAEKVPDEMDMTPEEVAELTETVSVICSNACAGLASAFAKSRGDEIYKFTQEDFVNFKGAFKYLARKHAREIASSPELYLFGVAIIGYATRVGLLGSTAIPGVAASMHQTEMEN